MKKLIEKLKGYLPISRKAYMEDLTNIVTVIQGLKQAEAQHSQIESNLIQHLNALQNKTMPTDKKKKDSGNNKMMYG